MAAHGRPRYQRARPGGKRPCPPYLARAIDDALDAGGQVRKAAAAVPVPLPDTEKVRRSLEDVLADGQMSPAMLAGWEASADRYGYRTRDTPSPVLLADLTADIADLRLAVVPPLGPHRPARRRRGRRRPGAVADRIHGQLSGEALAASAFGYAESQLRFHAGDALTRLGDTGPARRELRRALELCPPDDYTDRSLAMLDMAACMIADGDPEAGMEHAARALGSLDSQRRQGIIDERAWELLAALPLAVSALPAARHVRDLLQDTAP